MTTAPLFADGPGSNTASSSDGANSPFLVTDLDSDTGLDELLCEHCGTDLTYSGRGPKPRFCPEHKDKRAREPKPAAAPPSSPASASAGSKKKKNPGEMYGVAWAGAGLAIATKMPDPLGPPVGRVMQLQAGDAGPRLHRLLGPTFGKIPFIKRITANSGDLGDLGALLLPPLLTAALALEVVPPMMFAPLLAQLLRPMAADLLKASREQAAAIGEMGEAEAEVTAAVQELMASIFGTPEEGT